MVTNPPHRLLGLSADALEERLVGWIKSASKEEVLPDEQTQLITEIVEDVGLVDAAAPDAQHVHVGFDRESKQILIPGFTHPRQNEVAWYPVGTPTEDGYTVHLKAEARSRLTRNLILQQAKP